MQSQPQAPAQLISLNQIRKMASVIDPREKLDADLEQMLVEVATDFLADAGAQALALAQHRGEDSLNVDDVMLAIDRKYHIKVPGFNQDIQTVSAKAGVKKMPTRAHAGAVQAIRAAAVAEDKKQRKKKGELDTGSSSGRGRRKRV
ncbi:Transcription initiation factor TFIID subunit 12 [Chytriomyces hyalinus]|nr:Transcription initiation factor TFIID subunit 12 [Chytriomyces hyalinus]